MAKAPGVERPLISRRHWREYGAAIRFAAILGLGLGVAAGATVIKPPLTGALFGALSATTDMAVGMAIIGAIELFLPRMPAGRRLFAQPFLVVVLAKALAYLAVVVLVIGGRLGPRVAVLAASPETAQLLAAQIETGFPRGLLIAVASLVTFLLVMLRHASQIVGERSFRDIMRGRYHRPRAEDRFFLFVDVVGSTPVAEQLGPLAVHRYLDRVFQVAYIIVSEHALARLEGASRYSLEDLGPQQLRGREAMMRVYAVRPA